jgi:hypothetical protein
VVVEQEEQGDSEYYTEQALTYNPPRANTGY